jgi:hypothetical protein
LALGWHSAFVVWHFKIRHSVVRHSDVRHSDIAPKFSPKKVFHFSPAANYVCHVASATPPKTDFNRVARVFMVHDTKKYMKGAQMVIKYPKYP